MNDRIVTWADKFGGRSLRAHAAMSPSFTGDRTLPAEGLSLASSATARVNGGRWIADCPFSGCGGAEYVNFDDPVFFCCECRNAASGHQPIPLSVPSDDLRAGVESALIARPVPRTRNWDPTETVETLLDENDLMLG